MTDEHATAPTPFADVNAVVVPLRAGVVETLGDHAIGMYLTGSLATDDYVPGRSDIDFVVVTRQPLAAELASAVEALHHRLATERPPEAPWVEGIYVDAGIWRRHPTEVATCFRLTVEGSFGEQRMGANWIIERAAFPAAIALFGPEPATLVDDVADRDAAEASLKGTLAWWPHTLDDPGLLPDEAHLVFAVLTMARAWFTVERSRPGTKTESAEWLARTHQHWAPLLEEALRWRRGKPFDRRSEVEALIRATLDHLGAVAVER